MQGKRAGVVLVVTAVLAAVPLIAGIHSRRSGHGEPGAMLQHLHSLHGELDLTEAQKTQLKNLHERVREENSDSRRELHGSLVDAGKLLLANPDDIAGARAILQQKAAAERELRENVLRAVAEGMKILTPAQRAQIASKLDEAPRH